MSFYGGYLIYHPKRAVSTFDDLIVYHDAIGGNQDPYVWNARFLHTYCHMYNMSPQIGHINFWVSGDTYPEFSALYCDLVFVVQSKLAWPREQTNGLARANHIIDSQEAYIDHYQWAGEGMHPYQHRGRFTLKADPAKSFQPQDGHGQLFDVVDILQDAGLPLAEFREKIRTHAGSRPFPIDADTAEFLYSRLKERADLHLTGACLQAIRAAHPELSSGSTGKLAACSKAPRQPSRLKRCR
jgi:hypothetical protein